MDLFPCTLLWHCRGREFDPPWLHQNPFQINRLNYSFRLMILKCTGMHRNTTIPVHPFCHWWRR